jgi:pimeloyl-ACP methyl ester carboxylesterase
VRTVDERRLALPHLALAAREWPGDGPKVLALHGWLDNAASFDPLLPLLPDVHAVAIDLPGHGRSDHRPPGAWYHLVDNLSEIDAALDALGWPRAILLGHSMGAALATLYAAARPGRIDALWLIEGLGPLAAAESEWPAHLRRALDGRARAADKQLRVFASVDEAVAARLAATPMAESSARRLVERGLRAADGGFVWSSDPRLLLPSPYRASEAQVEACLAAIECPTLLVTASETPPYFPPALVARRTARVRTLTHRVVSGRHHVHMDDAAAVAATIEDFRAA